MLKNFIQKVKGIVYLSSLKALLSFEKHLANNMGSMAVRSLLEANIFVQRFW